MGNWGQIPIVLKQLESDPNYQLLAEEEQQLRGHGHRDFGG